MASVTFTGTMSIDVRFYHWDFTQPPQQSGATSTEATFPNLPFSNRDSSIAKCIYPSVGLNNQTYSPADAEETAFAAVDPAGDVSLVETNQLEPLGGLDAPGFVDLAGALFFLGGEQGDEYLYGSLTVHDEIPLALTGQDTFLSFDILILNPNVGATGSVLFEDALVDLSFDGLGANAPLGASTYVWNGQGYVEDGGLPVDFYRGDQWLAFQVPLDELGMTPDEVQNAELRVITQIITTRTGSSRFFADVCSVPAMAVTDTSAFATCP